MKIDRRLLAFLPSARGPLALSVAAGLGVGLTAVAQAYLLARAIDQAFLYQATVLTLLPVLAALLGCALLKAALTWLEPVASHHCAARIQRHLLDILLQALSAKGPYHLREQRSGQLVELLTRGRESLTAWYAQYLPALLQAAILPLMTLFFVFPADLLTGVILLLTAPLIPVFTILIGTRARALSNKQWGLLERLSSGLLDRIQGLETLKNLNQAWAQARELEKEGQAFRAATMKVLKTAFLSAMALELVATLATALVAVSVGIRLLKGHLGFDTALFVLILAPDFFRPLRRLGANFHAALEGSAAAEKLFSFTQDGKSQRWTPNRGEPLQEPGVSERNVTHPTRSKQAHADVRQNLVVPHDLSLLRDKPAGGGKNPLGTGLLCQNKTAWEGKSPLGTGLISPNGAAPLLELRNISFRHPESGFGIEGLSLILHDHELVALVGSSGSGKSTILDLILGFMAPDSGEICIKGQAFCAESREEWLSQIGWMSQRPHLFHESLAYNIALGSPNADPTEILKYAKEAGLGPLLDQLPGGLETVVGEEGARLSGGQAQRVALARVLQKACPLLLLDEPSAHLDPNSGRALINKLKNIQQNSGILVVAHSLELARQADRVLYMENGHLLAEGSHAEVQKACPQYAALVATQWGGQT